jgi:acetolactate synthase-1/2/3 large subunit
MYDQSSLVRDVVKYTYEMRYPEQGGALAARAVTLAMSEPRGPVYLSLPREPLMEACAVAPEPPRPPASPAAPDPAAIATAAAMIRAARAPVILCQRGDAAGRLGPALSAFASRLAIPVAEPFVVRNVLASADPMCAGSDAGAALEGSDLVIVLDSPVPWIERAHGAKVVKAIHIGPDPHFARMPVRGYRTDLAITADPVAAIAALDAALDEPGPDLRRRSIRDAGAARRAGAKARAEAASGEPMGPEWLSACVSEILGDTGIAFTELGLMPEMMALQGQNRLFSNPHSGGLGWGMTAALGAQLADRNRLVVACIGDGSYLFANPPACHQIAEALDLPILTIVKNNAMWNAVRRSVLGAYPGGAAAKANQMPLVSLEPQPDFCAIARASRAHAEVVTRGADLPGALQRALKVIREERRQVLLDVRVAASDAF